MKPLRIGFLYLPWPGHLNPLAGLGRELAGRGHQVAFFHLHEFAQDAVDRGLTFVPLGGDCGHEMRRRFDLLGDLEGPAAAAAGLQLIHSLAQAVLALGPAAVRAYRPDLLVVDQMDYAASTLAKVLSIPFVTAAVTLLKQDEEGIPGFSGTPYRAQDHAMKPPLLQAFLDDLGERLQSANLGPFGYDTLWSNLAQISQQPPEFEFPRKRLPPWFHFTGPFAVKPHAPGRRVDFPWDRLDGRPLVYASLGTALNRKRSILESIVSATTDLGVQLVLSSALEWSDLPDHVVSVPFAPQLEILGRTNVMVHHAGMNSALECLAAGVPMVALPVAHDQPGVACRIEMSGTGLHLPPGERTVEKLGGALRQVLQDDSYRKAARRLQSSIAKANGLVRAAEVVEEVGRTGRPVLYKSPEKDA